MDGPHLESSGPFVINLSSSSVPISLSDSGISVAPNTRVYQIKRMEDRRVRYRLRLGPFLTESQANAILAIVRDGYPAALTATANAEDLEALADIQFDAVMAQAPTGALTSKPTATPAPVPPPALVPAPAPATKVSAAPAAKSFLAVLEDSLLTIGGPTPPEKAKVVTAAASTSAPKPAAIPELTLMADSTPLPARAKPPANPVSPILSTFTLELMPDPPRPEASFAAPAAAQAAAPAFKTGPKPVTTAAKPTSQTKPIAQAAKPAAGKMSGALAKAPLPTTQPSTKSSAKPPAKLESTQAAVSPSTTVLEDAPLSRWFAIELSSADRPFDPEAVPNLDIFRAYRLYSVELAGASGVAHTLRLGFFGEASAAQAVADYLVDHYEKPVVKRVSFAERERFSERRLEARKNVETTGKHASIEITDQRYVRALR